MNKSTRFKVMALLAITAVTFSAIPSSQGAAKVFKNCTELNKIYPGGIALPGAINAGGVTKMTPHYDKALYLANKKSDRDKDGIVCEK
jgi:hypothetical protein